MEKFASTSVVLPFSSKWNFEGKEEKFPAAMTRQSDLSPAPPPNTQLFFHKAALEKNTWTKEYKNTWTSKQKTEQDLVLLGKTLQNVGTLAVIPNFIKKPKLLQKLHQHDLNRYLSLPACVSISLSLKPPKLKKPRLFFGGGKLSAIIIKVLPKYA